MQRLRMVETLRSTVRDAEEALQTGILRVRGKALKERAIPLHNQFRDILAAYLEKTDPRTDRESLLGILRTTSEEILDDFCSRYGKTFTLNTMRRTFGRSLWLLGVQLETISGFLGHSRNLVGVGLSIPP